MENPYEQKTSLSAEQSGQFDMLSNYVLPLILKLKTDGAGAETKDAEEVYAQVEVFKKELKDKNKEIVVSDEQISNYIKELYNSEELDLAA